MDLTIWVVVALIFIALIIVALATKNKTSKKSKTPRSDYKYQKRPSLLTHNELKFYKALLPVSAAKKLVVCPKVRLEDIIEAPKGPDYNAARGRIKSRHIDFMLCDPNTLQPILALELDDNTHDKPDRKERDQFIDKALGGAGIGILHTRTTTGLAEQISQAMRKK